MPNVVISFFPRVIYVESQRTEIIHPAFLRLFSSLFPKCYTHATSFIRVANPSKLINEKLSTMKNRTTRLPDKERAFPNIRAKCRDKAKSHGFVGEFRPDNREYFRRVSRELSPDLFKSCNGRQRALPRSWGCRLPFRFATLKRGWRVIFAYFSVPARFPHPDEYSFCNQRPIMSYSASRKHSRRNCF